jgi:hypothetical protein
MYTAAMPTTSLLRIACSFAWILFLAGPATDCRGVEIPGQPQGTAKTTVPTPTLDSLDGRSRMKVRERAKHIYRLPSGLVVDASNYVKALDQVQRSVTTVDQYRKSYPGSMSRKVKVGERVDEKPFSERVPGALFQVFGSTDLLTFGGKPALEHPFDFDRHWPQVEQANRLLRTTRNAANGDEVVGWASWYAKYFLLDSPSSYYFDTKLIVTPTAAKDQYVVSVASTRPGKKESIVPIEGVTIDSSLFKRGGGTELPQSREYVLVPTYSPQDPIITNGPGANATISDNNGKRIVSVNPPKQTGWTLVDAATLRMPEEEVASLILNGQLPLIEWKWNDKGKAWETALVELYVQKPKK